MNSPNLSEPEPSFGIDFPQKTTVDAPAHKRAIGAEGRRLRPLLSLGPAYDADAVGATNIQRCPSWSSAVYCRPFGSPATGAMARILSADSVAALLSHALRRREAPVHRDGERQHGTVRLAYSTPSWDELVELALDETRAFGAGQYQVVRRMRAPLGALIAHVPERRRPPLVRQLSLLDDAVATAIPETQRADALVADR